MKKLILNLTAICLATVLFAFINDADKNLLGTWNFTAIDAPEGYDQGHIEFSEKDGKLQGEMVTENDSFEMENLRVVNDSIIYELKVQSTVLKGLLVTTKDSLSGKIITPMGDLTIKGHKLTAK